MVLPSYLRFLVDRNVVMRRIPVIGTGTAPGGKATGA